MHAELCIKNGSQVQALRSVRAKLLTRTWELGTGNLEVHLGSPIVDFLSIAPPQSTDDSLTYTKRPLNPNGEMPLYGKMPQFAFPQLLVR